MASSFASDSVSIASSVGTVKSSKSAPAGTVLPLYDQDAMLFYELIKPYVKTHRWRARFYPNTFVGREACTVLLASGLCKSRQEAVQVGRYVERACNLFEHVHQDHEFSDSYYFYRFKQDNIQRLPSCVSESAYSVCEDERNSDTASVRSTSSIRSAGTAGTSNPSSSAGRRLERYREDLGLQRSKLNATKKLLEHKTRMLDVYSKSSAAQEGGVSGGRPPKGAELLSKDIARLQSQRGKTLASIEKLETVVKGLEGKVKCECAERDGSHCIEAPSPPCRNLVTMKPTATDGSSRSNVRSSPALTHQMRAC